MFDNFQRLVVDRIILGDFRGMGEDGRQETEVEAPFFVDRAIPMVVVAEWARTVILCTFAVEPCKAVVTLDCIRLYPVGRRPDRRVANTCEKFVGRRQIIFRAGVHWYVFEHGLTVRFGVVFAVPRDVLNPGLMHPQLYIKFLDCRQHEYAKMVLRISLPLSNGPENILVLAWITITQNVFASRL